MALQINFPEWRDANSSTTFPFAMNASLTNGSQAMTNGLFQDASIFVIGGQANLYLSQIDVAHDQVTIWIGDDANKQLASGSFPVPVLSGNIQLLDAYGRPAGLLISTPASLTILSTWGIGSFLFDSTQTPFAATVCAPMPEVGVRGIQLEDGSILTGEVWLLGADGVVLSLEKVTAPPAACGGPPRPYMVIRVDVVGDPLFIRQQCSSNSLFQTPQFLKTITFQDSNQSVVVGPDDLGDVKITVNNDLATDTVLRISPTPDGTQIEAVGTPAA
jgi:hypothetical protein